MTRLGAYLLAGLAACAPAPQDVAARAVPLSSSLPPIKSFAADPVQTPVRANAEIAQDFLDLTFRLESGREVPRLTRFDGPINVRIQGPATDMMVADLEHLLARLRSEALLPINLTNAASAEITVEAIPRATLSAAVPNAACFVVPRVSGWAEFRKARRGNALDWTTLDRREKATIFVPADVAPQEVRDCLHEELAQALGPLNDLYRLPDSVFNDDNIHNVLTSFDMLILRMTYAPELANGMRREDVAARLPALLARLNPGGQRAGTPRAPVTDGDWIAQVRTALSARETPSARRAAALNAVSLSQSQGWHDTRAAFALYAYGRLQVGHDSAAALAAFEQAEAIYRTSPATRIHAAHIAVQRAAFALANDDVAGTIAIVDDALPEASSHQNAALMATLMMFKAEALDRQGQDDAAQALRLDSLGWARYGFGSEIQVQTRMSEIAALRPS